MSTKFQVNLMKDVGGVAKTRYQTDGQTNGRMDGWMDRIMHTQTDEGHFYSPPLPTSGKKKTKCDLEIPLQCHLKIKSASFPVDDDILLL